MTSPIGSTATPGFLDWLKGDAGLAGRLALSWSLAGGLSMEVVLVAAAFLSGNPDAPSVPFTATLFFVLGAAGGFFHGALVGVAGRAPNVQLSESFRGVEAAAFWAIPVLLIGWVAALWISMTSVAVALAQVGMIFSVLVGWIACLVACSWALLEAQKGLAYAMQRWPERRPGGPLVAVTFATLVVTFVWYRPEIWFTDLRVSVVGALVLALGATVWIALPTTVFILHFLHHFTAENPIWGPSQVEETQG